MKYLKKASGLIQIRNKLKEQEHKIFNFLLNKVMIELYIQKKEVIRVLENKSLSDKQEEYNNNHEITLDNIFEDTDSKQIEQKLFQTAFLEASEIKVLKFKTSFGELKEKMNITNNKLIKDNLDNLSSKLIRVSDLVVNGKVWTEATFGFISGWKYIAETEEIEYSFHPDLFNLISQKMSEGNFVYAELDLSIQKNLNGKHSLWLYELAMDYRKIGKIEFTIEELRYFSGIEDNQYKLTKDFLKKVIIEPIEEINNKTDLNIKLTKNKQSRKISSVTFEIKQDDNTDLKEFMFRTFWTTILVGFDFKVPKYDYINIKSRKDKILLYKAGGEKIFKAEEAENIYKLVYKNKTNFYKWIKENIYYKDTKKAIVGEDMNKELNSFFYEYEDTLTEYQKKQFKKYTIDMNEEELKNIWK